MPRRIERPDTSRELASFSDCGNQAYRERQVCNSHRRNGRPGGTRTPDPLVRSQVLYPTELRVRERTDGRWRLPKRSSTVLRPRARFRCGRFHALPQVSISRQASCTPPGASVSESQDHSAPRNAFRFLPSRYAESPRARGHDWTWMGQGGCERKRADGRFTRWRWHAQFCRSRQKSARASQAETSITGLAAPVS